MYISVVEIDLPPNSDIEGLKSLFVDAGRRYVDVQGLLRKYYTLKDGKITGGVFVWDTLENAEAAHADPDWRKILKDRYGATPRITYYEVPVVVDNVLGKVLREDDYLSEVT